MGGLLPVGGLLQTGGMFLSAIVYLANTSPVRDCHP